MNKSIISTANGGFIDENGRQVILHGINLVNKDSSTGYIGRERPELFETFRSWGFNCVRLGVIWDGLEPQPGVFNESYLQKIDRQVAWARENELFVFLDMHQDLYSALFSDGAPAWATLTDGKPDLVTGSVWDDAYYTSPALQTAFDHFWQNSPAPDGRELQEHYAMTWVKLAERYCDEPAVIGYDLMNEPMPGAAALEIQLAMLGRGAELLAGVSEQAAVSAPEIAQKFYDSHGRLELFRRLDDERLFQQIVAAPLGLCQNFERQFLMPFYQRVGGAIRSVDPEKILFLETSGFSNFGVATAIHPLYWENLKRDSQQAYAPHSYDLVTDTDWVAFASPARLKRIFDQHAQAAAQHGWPMLVGEWGAYGFTPDTLPAAQAVVRYIEKLLCGETYWCYQPDLPSAPCFHAIHRPYPERIAGRLESYHYDPTSGIFECVWQEEPLITADTVIYLPDWIKYDPARIMLEPGGSSIRYEDTGKGGWLHIPPAGVSGRRIFCLGG